MPSSSPGEQGSRSVPAPPWTAGRLGTEIGPQKNISKKNCDRSFSIFYITCTSKKKNCARMCLATRWGFIVRFIFFIMMKNITCFNFFLIERKQILILL